MERRERMSGAEMESNHLHPEQVEGECVCVLHTRRDCSTHPHLPQQDLSISLILVRHAETVSVYLHKWNMSVLASGRW